VQLLTRLGLIAFCAALGVAVAYRITTEAWAMLLAVIIGGMFAGVPSIMLAFYVIRQMRDMREPSHRPRAETLPQPPPQQPQIYVVAPGQLPYQQTSQWGVPGMTAPVEDGVWFGQVQED
jgi:hypothetical protein